MNVRYTKRLLKSYTAAPEEVRRAFHKQVQLLLANLRHPSLHAKKYDEARDVWQARINRDWRFYFTISDDTYEIVGMKPHPG
jgi:mRNA-degrading endonuclease RelE of RelBE toxin-antitoxin system